MNAMAEFNQETALLRRRSTLIRWESFRLTVGLGWDRASSTLGIYPVPCVALYVHLPARRTRTGVVRWFRAREALISAFSVAIMIAVGGFFVGRWSLTSPHAASTTASTVTPRSALERSATTSSPLPLTTSSTSSEPPVVATSAVALPVPSAEPSALSSARRLAVPSSSQRRLYDPFVP